MIILVSVWFAFIHFLFCSVVFVVLSYTSLCYSNAKCTLLVLLTFNKIEKIKHEYFDFVHLLPFLFFSFLLLCHTIPKTIQWWILCAPNDCYANGNHSYMFWAASKLYESCCGSYLECTFTGSRKWRIRGTLSFSVGKISRTATKVQEIWLSWSRIHSKGSK